MGSFGTRLGGHNFAGWICIESHHDEDVIWKRFPLYWSFVKIIHRTLEDSLIKGQRCRVLILTVNLALRRYTLKIHCYDILSNTLSISLCCKQRRHKGSYSSLFQSLLIWEIDRPFPPNYKRLTHWNDKYYGNCDTWYRHVFHIDK